MKTKLTLLIAIIVSHMLLSSCVPAIQGASTVSSIASVSNDRRSAGVVLDDKTIHIKLVTSLTNDVELEETHLNFMIYDKGILVAGEVPNNAVKSYVLNKIQIIAPDTKQIYNEMTIGPTSGILSRTKDSAITVQIEARFHEQEVFHPTHVRVMTENQNVYLMGAVTDREGSMAAKVAAKAKGVKRVVKMFDYLESRPQSEIDRDKQKELNAKEQAALEKLKQDLKAEQEKIQQKIDKLNASN